MKVILLQNVAGLGKADDIREVAEGYARNFLFPRHLAVLSSSQGLAEIEAQKKKKSKDELRDLQQQQSLAAKLDGVEVKLKEKASASGVLYAAIGPKQISDALTKMGFAVDKEKIRMAPIKEAGEFEVKIRLRHGLEAKISIVVSV
ncbi:MAG: 50S ribosomal protein L9 [Candidatus Magasanikbacteria bacterium]|jgi:large subunit ribosomal protein L9